MEIEKKKFFKDHEWVFVEEGLLDNHEKFLCELNRTDLVIIPTLRSDYDFFLKMKLDPPVVLCIHNINYWLCPKKRLQFWEIPGIQRKFQWFMKGKWKAAEQKKRINILKNMNAVNFHNPAMDMYFRSVAKSGGLDSHIKISHLPFTYYVPENLDQETETPVYGSVVIGVPGQIVDSRKDYREILDALSIVRDRLEKPMETHFIGRFDCSPLYREWLMCEFSKIETPKSFTVKRLRVEILSTISNSTQ